MHYCRCLEVSLWLLLQFKMPQMLGYWQSGYWGPQIPTYKKGRFSNSICLLQWRWIFRDHINQSNVCLHFQNKPIPDWYERNSIEESREVRNWRMERLSFLGFIGCKVNYVSFTIKNAFVWFNVQELHLKKCKISPSQVCMGVAPVKHASCTISIWSC